MTGDSGRLRADVATVTMDAVLSIIDPGPRPRAGSAREELARDLRYLIRLLRNARAGAMIAAVHGEAQHDPELAAEVEKRVQAPRRAAAKRILEDGVARGELRADLDCDAVFDLIYGPLFYRFLIAHKPTPSGYADVVLDHVWPTISARS